MFPRPAALAPAVAAVLLFLPPAGASKAIAGGSRASALPRGVGPRDEARYRNAIVFGKFQCLNTKVVVDLEVVNDDFCDCDDGSDEPGTAACAAVVGRGSDQALFFCANNGSQAKYLHRSRVDDGVCDCCDGSDEWRQVPLICPDICFEQGRPAREAEAKRFQTWRKGSNRLAELLTAFEATLEHRRQEVERVRAELHALEKLRDARKRKVRETANALPVSQEVGGEISSQQAAAAKVDKASSTTPPALPSEANGAAEASTEGEKPKISEYAKWMESADTSAVSEHSKPPSTEPTDRTEDAQVHQKAKDVLETEASFEVKVHREAQAALEAANQAVKDAKYLLWGLEAGLDTRLSGGYRALANLREKCLEKDKGSFNYKVCFFRVVQQNTDSAKNVSLGRWMGWDFSSSPPRARFDRGEPCGNKRRKTTVSFVCGSRPSIGDVSEPETCVYEVQVEHPGACDPSTEPEKKILPPLLPHDEL